MTYIDPQTRNRIADLEARLRVAHGEVNRLDARIAELEALLEERSAGHLAEIERVQERANQEAAVHRHEAQRAVAEAGEARTAARELVARVEQLEAEAAALGRQTAAVAAQAARAERESAGYRQIAAGWATVADARAEDRTPRRTGPRP